VKTNRRPFAAALILSIFIANSAASAAVVYELSALASFDSANGENPIAGLIADADGNFYGTTSVGGAYGQGTIFRLEAATNTLTTLASFDGVNGASPHAGLIADAGGNLYGTAVSGGASGEGTVFRWDAGTNTLSALASFNGVDGRSPSGGLIAEADGNLYGTTRWGGSYNHGTVYRIEAGTHAISTLALFNADNGSGPFGSLVADADGNLYGTTSDGGANFQGTVFRLNAGTNTITTLASFDGANGAYPYAGLIADAQGNLYGTTSSGGDFGLGNVFRLAAGTNALTTLASFNGTNGALPIGGLTADAEGNFYGTTYFGGQHGVGAVFKLSAVELNPIEGTRLLTFEGLANREDILDYYAGGTGSIGSGPGPSFGISFTSGALALIDSDSGGSGNFANEPSPDAIAFFESGSELVMNVPAGFQTGLSFFYATTEAGSISIYDGLDATGNVLATIQLVPTPGIGTHGGDPNGSYDRWDPIGVNFAGIARSVSFAGAANYIGFDNITLGSATPIVPEPGSALLAAMALLVYWSTIRRRNAA
jgi:uncharacterized repeat protein (TIGR03803 family)